MKKNLSLILIGITTITLAAIAIVTALKIYQSGTNPIAPNAPESKPEAQTQPPYGDEPLPTPTTVPSKCILAFNLNLPTATVTPTTNPSATPTLPTNPTATPTTPLDCYHTCVNNEDCEGALTCQTVAGSKKCVNSRCSNEQDCICNKTCWEICGQNSECPGGTTCRSIDGTYRCVNPSCDREQDCSCGLAQKPTPTKTTTAIPEETLPNAGTDLPTLGLFAGGLILILIPLLLAF